MELLLWGPLWPLFSAVAAVAAVTMFCLITRRNIHWLELSAQKGPIIRLIILIIPLFYWNKQVEQSQTGIIRIMIWALVQLMVGSYPMTQTLILTIPLPHWPTLSTLEQACWIMEIIFKPPWKPLTKDQPLITAMNRGVTIINPQIHIRLRLKTMRRPYLPTKTLLPTTIQILILMLKTVLWVWWLAWTLKLLTNSWAISIWILTEQPITMVLSECMPTQGLLLQMMELFMVGLNQATRQKVPWLVCADNFLTRKKRLFQKQMLPITAQLRLICLLQTKKLIHLWLVWEVGLKIAFWMAECIFLAPVLSLLSTKEPSPLMPPWVVPVAILLPPRTALICFWMVSAELSACVLTETPPPLTPQI